MTRSRLHTLARGAAWATGIGYVLIWLPVLWLVFDGAFLAGNPACAPVRSGPTVFWSCEAGVSAVFVATMVNAALGVTVWSPIVIVLALYDMMYLPLALAVVSVHVCGVSALVYAVWRLTWRGYERVRRSLVPA